MRFPNSRYISTPTVTVSDDTGVYHPTVLNHDRVSGGFNYQPYVVKSGDRLDLLAHRFLGNADLWWYIADYNPELTYPDTLTPGTIIRIPK